MCKSNNFPHFMVLFMSYRFQKTKFCLWSCQLHVILTAQWGPTSPLVSFHSFSVFWMMPCASPSWNTQDQGALITLILWDRAFPSSYIIRFSSILEPASWRVVPVQQLWHPGRAHREQNWVKNFLLNGFVNITINVQFFKTML